MNPKRISQLTFEPTQMKAKNLLVIFLIVINVYGIQGQACKGLEQWKQIILKEYPNTDFANYTRYNRREIADIKFNLFSDTYFKIVSKKPLDELSSKQRVALINKLSKCGIRNRKYKDDFAQWYYRILKKGFYQKPSEIQASRKLRRDYNSLVRKLKSNSMSSSELESLISSVNLKFKRLLPSELQYLKTLLNNSKSTIADASVESLLAEVKNCAGDLNGLYQLRDFRLNNRLFYANASKLNIDKIEGARNDKINSILSNLMKEETQKFKELKSIKDINNTMSGFKERYRAFLTTKLVADQFTRLKRFKTLLIEKRENEFTTLISGIKSKTTLNTFRQTFLTNVVEDNPAIQRIQSAFNFEEEKIDFAIEAERKQEKLKSILVDNYKSQVKLGRKSLSSKYGSYLPSLGDFREFIGAFRKVVNDFKGEYNRYDGRNFIKKIEYYGYIRKDSGNLSNGELFIDKNGNEIVASSKDKSWDRNIAYVGVSLLIKNAPQEIFELYEKEFRSELRQTNNEFFDVSNELKIGKFYTSDGAYLYRISKNEDNVLQISAVDNEEGNFPVIAEKVAKNQVTVTPWTSYTPIRLRKGRKIRLWTSDYIKLGVFSVNCYADGISGFRWNNLEGAKNFPHGSLIGKFGKDDPWMFIGKDKTITPIKNGLLWLKINDGIPQDNTGVFRVKFEYIYEK